MQNITTLASRLEAYIQAHPRFPLEVAQAMFRHRRTLTLAYNRNKLETEKTRTQPPSPHRNDQLRALRYNRTALHHQLQFLSLSYPPHKITRIIGLLQRWDAYTSTTGLSFCLAVLRPLFGICNDADHKWHPQANALIDAIPYFRQLYTPIPAPTLADTSPQQALLLKLLDMQLPLSPTEKNLLIQCMQN